MAQEITFYWDRRKNLQPMEWLQYIAASFSGLADLWDEYDSDYFEYEFEEYKTEQPKIHKLKMYDEISQSVNESLLHAYIYDSMDIAKEIEHLRGNIVKAFEGSVIFPNLLNAIGIIEFVMLLGESLQGDFYYCLHYCVASTPEEADEWFGKGSAKSYKKESELTIDDYEKAFDCVTEFLETIEKGQCSAKLRESAWAISGFCKLKTDPEKYEEIKTKIAKRKNRPTAADMARRNKAVAYSAGEIKAKHGRLATVDEIIEATKYNRSEIYATTAYKEGKIAKASAKLTIESTGSSVAPSEQFEEKSIEHSRSDRQSNSDKAELDALIDQQEKDDSSNFAP